MHVLIVDDDPDIRALLRQLLARHDHLDLAEAEDGRAALKMVRTRPPALLITDLSMPVMGGRDLVAALRRDPSTSSVPVVAVSAVSEREQVLQMVELGIHDYLVKPIDAADASVRLAAILARLGEAPDDQARRARPQLLVVDRDPEHATWMAGQLADRFHVLVEPYPPRGMQRFLDQRVPVVLVSEGLPLRAERRFAATARAGWSGRVLLVRDADAGHLADPGSYDGVVVRSRDPAEFRASFDAAMAHRKATATELALLLNSEFIPAVLAAAGRATAAVLGVGVTTDTGGEPVEGPAARVLLADRHSGARLHLALVAELPVLAELDARVLGADTRAAGGAGFTRLAEAIALELREVIAAEGIVLESQPESSFGDANLPAPLVRVPLRVDGKARARIELTRLRARPGP